MKTRCLWKKCKLALDDIELFFLPRGPLCVSTGMEIYSYSSYSHKLNTNTQQCMFRRPEV